MTISILLIILGFVLLIKGADWMVNGATSLAKKKRVSDLAIGLTIVAFGTSAPELVVNSIGSFQNQSDIVFGNVIGSNNFNLFFILGIVGLILPITVQSSTVWKEIPISFIAALLILGLSNSYLWQNDPILSRLDGVILLLMFGFFLFYVYKQMKNEGIALESAQISIAIENQSNRKIWGLIIIGLAGLVIGGKLVVDNAIEIATELGISKKIIGLTIIAAGTSLPELVTSVVAALKKNSDIAIGNVIGSNIFNIFFILSISSLINPIEYNRNFNMDIYLLLGGTFLLFIAMFTGKKRKLDRWEAGLLLLIFIVYTLFLIGNET
ncbi:calcium/sodium antiporter [Marivirga sp. S37H4]|uniref:Calcium/sodium antiporter n=1 Tax=Marivirga aurantiaca TaxID=2802615 RepID=A0A934WYW7_9BACT|nr:calcium/sodium antiporter [Marivirga aurantiaca]MBK6265365.1 calcium/sodium antiporter [Marivirga aurantiaca]